MLQVPRKAPSLLHNRIAFNRTYVLTDTPPGSCKEPIVLINIQMFLLALIGYLLPHEQARNVEGGKVFSDLLKDDASRDMVTFAKQTGDFTNDDFEDNRSSVF